MKKRLFSLMLAFAVLCVPASAFAADEPMLDNTAEAVMTDMVDSEEQVIETDESEEASNDTLLYALDWTKSYTGSITSSNDTNTYSVSLTEAGKLNISLIGSSGLKYVYFKIYDASGNQLYSQSLVWNSTTQQISYSDAVDLTKGTYSLVVSQYGSYTGTYTLSLSFAGADESISESQGGSNNSVSAADSISLNTSYNGQIAINDDVDVYKFVLNSSGSVDISFTGYLNNVYLKVYDETGNEILKETLSWNSTIEQISYDETFDFTKGTYYYSVSKYGSRTGNYTFSLNYTNANESFSEPQGGSNNSVSAADSISLNTSYNGQIAINDDVDVYKFVLNSSGSVDISFTGYFRNVYLKVYDETGNEILKETLSWNSTIEQISYDDAFDFTSGTYYYSVSKYGSRTGNYTFSLNYTNANESFSEPQGGSNNAISSADSINLNRTYRGQIAINDTVDIYEFTLNKTTDLEIIFSGHINKVYLKLYDENANSQFSKSYSWNSTSQLITVDTTETLDAGTYYFTVEQYSSYTGNYSFKLSDGSASEFACSITERSNTLTYSSKTVSGNLSLAVSNNNSSSVNAEIITALYSSSGEMLDVLNVSNETLSAGNNTLTLKNLKSTNAAAGCYVKVFVWDSFDKITPLSESLQLEVY